MNRRLAVVPLIMTAVFGLTACSQTTVGSGSPATTTAGSTQSGGNSGGSPSSAGGSTSLKSIQPCALLSSSELSENQLTKADSGTGSGARSCSWQNVTANNGIGYVIGADIRDAQGLNDINTAGYSVSPDPIGRHQGMLLQQIYGNACAVVIGVSSSSRVDVSANGAGDISQACQWANQFARLVEPKLP